MTDGIATIVNDNNYKTNPDDEDLLDPLAWCGWSLMAPPSLRLSKTDGNAQFGMIGLSDAGQSGLDLFWYPASKRRPEEKVERRLFKGLSKKAVDRATMVVTEIDNNSFRPLKSVDDTIKGITRCVGYAPLSGRVLEVIYKHEDQDQRHALVQTTSASLVDQATDEPQRWACYGCSFIAPTDLRLEKSILRLGDIELRLVEKTPSGRFRSSVTIRQVYPAGLALKRQSMHRWMAHLLADQQRDDRNRKTKLPKAVDCQPIKTQWGDGLAHRASRQGLLKIFQWFQPKHQLNYLIHDPLHNRLILLQVAQHADDLDSRMTALVEGLHWAAPNGAMGLSGHGI